MLFNLSLLVSCAFLLSLSYHEWPVRRRRAEHVLRVALASGASWLLMIHALRLEGFRLDLRYVDNWSPVTDVWILLRTVQAVFSHRGAY